MTTTQIITRDQTDLTPQKPNIAGVETDGELLDLWIHAQESHHTKRLYNRVGMKFLSTLPHGVKQAKLTDINRFEKNLQRLSPTSRHTEMAALRSFFRFAERTDYIPKSPAHIKSNKAPPKYKRDKILTTDEVRLMIYHAGNVRNAHIFRFLYGTGVRIDEFVKIKVKDIYQGPNGMQMVTITGKRKRVREVPIPTYARIKITKECHPEDAVFTSETSKSRPYPALSESTVRYMISMAAIESGIRKKVSPHWFRHSISTHLQDKGMSPKNVQELLGHASLDTTTAYSHVTFTSPPAEIMCEDIGVV